MSLNKRGQGSLELVLIIGGVLVVVLVAGAFLGGFTSPLGGQTTENTAIVLCQAKECAGVVIIGNQAFQCSGNFPSCQSDLLEDTDVDGVYDDVPDNCLFVPNGPSEDNQADSDADCGPTDIYCGDACDNCPADFNPGWADLDTDGLGDACDDDRDGDSVLNDVDNCPDDRNGPMEDDQADLDNDGYDPLDPLTGGDACDADVDGDLITNDIDNCPVNYNPGQEDSDGNGNGDACDDQDMDGFLDAVDNCPTVANPIQENFDESFVVRNIPHAFFCPGWGTNFDLGFAGDGLGDACDTDDDADGVLDGADLCDVDSGTPEYCVSPYVCLPANNPEECLTGVDGCDTITNCFLFCSSGQFCNATTGQCDVDPDTDNDGVNNDVPDNCPNVPNPGQEDDDVDGYGNVCDNCPAVSNPFQTNTDLYWSGGDALGDVCDTDDDADTVLDAMDNCPLLPNTTQLNNDGDSQGDVCDTDDDNDGVLDSVPDNCQFVPNPGQEDFDDDSLGNVCDDEIIIFSCGNLTPANTEPDVTGWQGGKTYVLANDVTNISSVCFNPAFTGALSTIDCLNKNINSPRGIITNGSLLVRNCRINVTGTTSSDYGVRVNVPVNLQNNTITATAIGNARGVYLTSSSSYSSLSNNTISNFDYGIYTESLSNISNLTVSSNVVCGDITNTWDILLSTNSNPLGSPNNTCKRNQCIVFNIVNPSSNVCIQKDGDGLYNDCLNDC